jgi:hypothetical protein
MSSHKCIILIIDQFTFPQAEVLVWTGCSTTSFPSAANSSARPQEQFLQAFLLPVVPHTLKNKKETNNKKTHHLCKSKHLHVRITRRHATQLLFGFIVTFLKNGQCLYVFYEYYYHIPSYSLGSIFYQCIYGFYSCLILYFMYFIVMSMYSYCMFMYGYPDWGSSMLFPQL